MKPSLHILVADDFEPIRDAVCDWLSADGHSVQTASSGKETIKLLASEPVDLVISDIIMPDGDGIELIRELKETRPDTKIIAISAGGRYFGAAHCLQTAKSLGADAALMKPFSHRKLAESISALFPDGEPAASVPAPPS